MSSHPRARASAVAGAVAVVLVALGLAGCGGGDPSEVRTVVLTMRHSRYRPDRVEVAAGATVRFVVRNADPIDHELIVGDAAVHERHEKGTEPHHGAVPGEVSVPAGGEATTTYTFGRAGTVEFGCHLPGHWDYGMRGVVVVD